MDYLFDFTKLLSSQYVDAAFPRLGTVYVDSTYSYSTEVDDDMNPDFHVKQSGTESVFLKKDVWHFDRDFTQTSVRKDNPKIKEEQIISKDFKYDPKEGYPKKTYNKVRNIMYSPKLTNSSKKLTSESVIDVTVSKF